MVAVAFALAVLVERGGAARGIGRAFRRAAAPGRQGCRPWRRDCAAWRSRDSSIAGFRSARDSWRRAEIVRPQAARTGVGRDLRIVEPHGRELARVVGLVWRGRRRLRRHAGGGEDRTRSRCNASAAARSFGVPGGTSMMMPPVASRRQSARTRARRRAARRSACRDCCR